MSQLTLKTPSTGQTGSGPLAWGRIRRHYPAGDCPVRLGEPGISDRR